MTAVRTGHRERDYHSCWWYNSAFVVYEWVESNNKVSQDKLCDKSTKVFRNENVSNRFRGHGARNINTLGSSLNLSPPILKHAPGKIERKVNQPVGKDDSHLRNRQKKKRVSGQKSEAKKEVT